MTTLPRAITLAIVLILTFGVAGQHRALCAAATPVVHEPLRITDGPYLQAPSETGVTIMWRTNNKSLSWVEYATDGTSLTVLFNSHHGLRDAWTTIHKVRLSGLKPGTTYRYRVICKDILDFKAYAVTFGDEAQSDEQRFTTLDHKKSSFSFIVLNDRHERAGPLTRSLESVQWQAVDLVFLNGDMLNHFENDQQIFSGVIGPCVGAFARSIPFIYARGNHETRGSLARHLPDYIATPNQKYFFALTHGPVRFVVLDCGEDKPDTGEEYSGLVDFDRYRDLQTQWLEKEIRSKPFRRAEFRVAFVHMPPWILGKEPEQNHGRQDIARKWGPLFEKGKLDLLICGHTHRFARVAPETGKHSYPILVGDTTTVIRADVSAREMRIAVTEADGRTVDEFVVSRRPGFWRKLFTKAD